MVGNNDVYRCLTNPNQKSTGQVLRILWGIFFGFDSYAACLCSPHANLSIIQHLTCIFAGPPKRLVQSYSIYIPPKRQKTPFWPIDHANLEIIILDSWLPLVEVAQIVFFLAFFSDLALRWTADGLIYFVCNEEWQAARHRKNITWNHDEMHHLKSAGACESSNWTRNTFDKDPLWCSHVGYNLDCPDSTRMNQRGWKIFCDHPDWRGYISKCMSTTKKAGSTTT